MNIPADLRRTFEDKIKRGIFKPIERFLHKDIREDRMQDALGLTWRLYADHAARGEILDDALLVHACRLRAIDLSRYVAQCDSGQRKRDVFHLRNYNAGQVEVIRLAHVHEEENEDEGHRLDKRTKPISVGFAELRCTNPTRKIHSAIDLNAWLAELPAEDQHMLELRAAGYGLEEIAREFGVSTSNIFIRCRNLGLALAERAGISVKPRTKTRKLIKSTRGQKAPASGVRPVRKARVRSESGSSTSRSKRMFVAA